MSPRLASAALTVSLAAWLAAPARLPAQSRADGVGGRSDAERVAERALRAQPVVDGHNDLPWAIREAKDRPGDVAAYDLRRRTRGHTDLARLRAGRVGAQFWSVYIPGEPDDPAYAPLGRAGARAADTTAADTTAAGAPAVRGTPGYARVQLEQIDVARRVIARYPDALALATRAADVAPAVRAGKVASFLGMEGGHAIEHSLGALRAYYDLGVRYMTLTHNVTTDWADAALDSARHGGLAPFGEEVVREMNRLGMLVDLSHTSDATMSDALRVARAPVIWSHSSARGVADHPRNVPDSVLAKLPANGGVVMVTFVGSFVSPARARREAGAPRATLAQVADHVEHVRRVAGVDHVGLGADYDGTTDLPVGLEDVSTYPALFAELARRGWTEAELRKLAGENVLRVLRQAEQTAARLQREGGAPRTED